MIACEWRFSSWLTGTLSVLVLMLHRQIWRAYCYSDLLYNLSLCDRYTASTHAASRLYTKKKGVMLQMFLYQLHFSWVEFMMLRYTNHVHNTLLDLYDKSRKSGTLCLCYITNLDLKGREEEINRKGLCSSDSLWEEFCTTGYMFCFVPKHP